MSFVYVDPFRSNAQRGDKDRNGRSVTENNHRRMRLSCVTGRSDHSSDVCMTIQSVNAKSSWPSPQPTMGSVSGRPEEAYAEVYHRSLECSV
jgi:hypothetical protein